MSASVRRFDSRRDASEMLRLNAWSAAVFDE
jgi:hypothetical protein